MEWFSQSLLATQAAWQSTVHTSPIIWLVVAAITTLIYVGLVVATRIIKIWWNRVPDRTTTRFLLKINDDDDVDRIWLTTFAKDELNKRSDMAKISNFDNVRIRASRKERATGKGILVELRTRKNPDGDPDKLQNDQLEMTAAAFSKMFPRASERDVITENAERLGFLLAKQELSSFGNFWKNTNPQIKFQNRLMLTLTLFGVFISAVSLVPLFLHI